MKSGEAISTSGYCDYGYRNAAPSHIHPIYLPHVFALCGPLARGTRVLDLGCGNGAVAGRFLELGCEVVGVDLSQSGIDVARSTWPRRVAGQVAARAGNSTNRDPARRATAPPPEVKLAEHPAPGLKRPRPAAPAPGSFLCPCSARSLR